VKSRTKAIEARLKKLEAIRNPAPAPSYVVRLSYAEWKLSEAAQRRIIAERSGGQPVAVMPEVCATAEEWLEQYRETH
jgi:hypothetical protein